MRLFHILLALAGALLLGVWLSGPLSEDPGYVLIRFQGWALETTAVAIIVCLIAVYFVWRIARFLLRQPQKAVQHLVARHEQARLEKGLLALTEGRWRRAEKLLSQSAKDSQLPTVHYLAAARAAQGRSADHQRDAYLLQAQGNSSAQFAVQLTRAELLLADDDTADAAVILETLHHERPRNAHVLQLLARCYQKLERFDELRQLLPALKREKVVDKTEAELLLQLSLQGALRQTMDVDKLQTVWKTVPRRLKHDAALIRAYAERAVIFDQHAEVEKLLRKQLQSAWDSDLVLLYGQLKTDEPTAQLKTAEGWLNKHPEDAALILTLARLCARAELWGKARDYYQRALNLSAGPEAYQELGQLYDAQGNTQAAMACYRNVLRLNNNQPVEPVVHT